MATRSVQVARNLSLALVLCAPSYGFGPQKGSEKPKRVPRTIWNFDGGIFLETDGSISETTCFRLAGRLVADHFFDDIKRIDDDRGTRYVRGKESITEFPDQVNLLVVIHDWPCPSQLHGVGVREYLTRDMMSKLKLSLFWKRGVELRPAENFKLSFFSVKPVEPYATELAKELPERLQWEYGLEIPSEGVPLSDSLVLILRRADGRIAARVAARM